MTDTSTSSGAPSVSATHANGASPPTHSSPDAPTPSSDRARADRPRTEADKLGAVSALLGSEAGRKTGADAGPAGESLAPPRGADAERADLVAGALEGGQDGEEGRDGEDAAETAEGASRARSAPRTVKDLGIPPEEFYKLELTTGDGEAVSIGAMKDAYADRQTAAREIATRSAELRDREVATASRASFLTEITDSLSGAVGPKLLEKAATQLAAHRHEMHQRMWRNVIEAAPELADQRALGEFINDVAASVEPFGVSKGDLANNGHPGLWRWARHMIQAERDLKRLMAYKPAAADPPKTRSGSGRGEARGSSTQAMMNRARTGTESDKVRGVDAILRGG